MLDYNLIKLLTNLMLKVLKFTYKLFYISLFSFRVHIAYLSNSTRSLLNEGCILIKYILIKNGNGYIMLKYLFI